MGTCVLSTSSISRSDQPFDICCCWHTVTVREKNQSITTMNSITVFLLLVCCAATVSSMAGFSQLGKRKDPAVAEAANILRNNLPEATEEKDETAEEEFEIEDEEEKEEVAPEDEVAEMDEEAGEEEPVEENDEDHAQ